MKPKLLFLTLNTFSATGGIEKVCRVAGKALYELQGSDAHSLSVYSLYDKKEQADETYFPADVFRGFGGQKLRFILSALRQGRGAGTVLISHINLLPVAYLLKRMSPSTRLVMMAHGIEVWSPLSQLKAKLLGAVDLFLPVSAYTAQKLQAVHRLPEKKIRVLNNCLDPFLSNEPNPCLQESLRKKYGIAPGEKVLLTVTRLKHSEQYKGYDKVVLALKKLSQHRLRYLIVGKYDAEEKARLDAIIRQEGLEGNVIFAGFAKDEELNSHFHLADSYVMPSKGEGFGVVFIEALYQGLPVIAGNADGSVDALAGGRFGKLVNPESVEEIAAAIAAVLENPERFRPNTDEVLAVFGYDAYKRKFAEWLGTTSPTSAKSRKAVLN